MKTSKIILTILLTCSCCFAQAQVVVQENSYATKKQFRIGQILTKQMATQLFGTPDDFYTEYDDEVYHGIYNQYEYPDFVFSTVDDKVLDFGVGSDKYVVIIDNKYIVQTGDRLETFKKMFPEGEVYIRTYDGWTAFHFKLKDYQTYSDDALVIKTDENGIITAITWNSPI